ncbi:cytochrome c-type biogenesis protein CcmH [Roseomonas stagni]|uniref:Cytochrome c-type biogenesis protein n=1 Tax=Falsiroseomonas algicola TaxID=2716930 RepID=A0A6M1LRV4_9PROT|nr:cytochrome c-type biogenesis protein [Falsiroseomonas algicola]NGM23178.1 cytochrome c-type biogenesis protein CcmH [Falsiroseomonas algicola]
MRKFLLAFALLLPFAAEAIIAPRVAYATTNPADMLRDPAQEERARALGREIRCMVCQNQSIEDSEVALARDLRLIVRERIVAGDSDAQVRDFLHARYGDFVLLRPPFTWSTAALWLTPVVALMFGAGLILLSRRRAAQPAPPAPLTEEEKRRLAALDAETRDGNRA